MLYKVLAVILLCCVLFCFVIGTVSHCVPVGLQGKATEEQPYYFEKPHVRWGEISDYEVCEDVLYILYGGKKILDCYDTDGTYLHSYALVLGEKGKCELYSKNGMIHLKTKGLTFYTFKEGFFDDRYTVSASELSSKIQSFENEENGDYTFDGVSIWRNTERSKTEVIHRPLWMAVFQGSILSFFGGLCWIVFCFFCIRRKIK